MDAGLVASGASAVRAEVLGAAGRRGCRAEDRDCLPWASADGWSLRASRLERRLQAGRRKAVFLYHVRDALRALPRQAAAQVLAAALRVDPAGQLQVERRVPQGESE